MDALTIQEEDAVIETLIEEGLLEYRPAFSGYGIALFITEKGREVIADVGQIDPEENWLLQRIENL